ncbi:EamA family transporter [Xinfangfangia sp. D13-10-4-6]|uniref:EamA family transporter n=1 Tax=Pseudogemmobacter hezensis TaxID=2737662 RepID=UPI00155257BD|nr:EamA family transporter [Pseudogemmobacter hezensis]NPD14192.1 EamA family transporter [Pseudogemmobacter hezensis]
MIGPKTGAAICAILWGFTYLLAGHWLPPHPEMAGAIRALGGAAFLFLLQRQMPAPGWWGRLIVLGTLNVGLFFGLFFVGAMRLQGGVAAVFQALGPVFVLILAWMILKRRPSGLQLLAVSLGLVGVAMVVLKDGATIDALGVVAMLGCVLSISLGGVLLGRWGSPGIGVVSFTAWQLLIGGAELTLVALLIGDFQGPLSGQNILAFVILAVVLTGIPFLLWFRGLEAVGAVGVMPLILLTPVTALVLDAVLLRIMPAPLQLLGVAVVMLSLFLNQRALAAR